MDPDAAAGKLAPVAHQIIVLGVHPLRSAVQKGNILILRCGEWVMHRLPPTPLALLQQGVIEDEAEDKNVGVCKLQAAGHLLAQCPQRSLDHCRLPSNDEEEIPLARLKAPRHLLALLIGEELVENGSRMLPPNGQSDQALCPIILYELGQLIELATGVMATARGT